MALVSQPHRAPEGSLLAASQKAQEEDRSKRNEQHEMKRVERLGRRAYRASLRGRDPSAYLGGLKALEEMRLVNGSTGAGISMAGSTRERIDRGVARTEQELLTHEGRLQEIRNGQPPAQARSRLQPKFNGLDRQAAMQDDAKFNAWATGNGPGIPTGEAGQAQPAAGQPSLMPPQFQTPRQQFAQSLLGSTAIQNGDPGAIIRAREQAQNEFGIKSELFDGFLARNSPMPRPSVPTLASPPPDVNASGRAAEIGAMNGKLMADISRILGEKTQEDAARVAAKTQQEQAAVAAGIEKINADAAFGLKRMRIENEAAALGLEYDPANAVAIAPPASPVQAPQPRLAFGDAMKSDFRNIFSSVSGLALSAAARAPSAPRVFDSAANALDSFNAAPASVGALLPGEIGRYYKSKSLSLKEQNKKNRSLREAK